MLNHTLKTSLALLLSILVLISSLPAIIVSAEEFTSDEGFTYEIKSDAVTITKYNGDATDLIIPETIEGYPVTALAYYAFYGNSNLSSITIPDTITYIDYNVFTQCDNLKKVYISDLAAWCNIDFNYDSNPLNMGGELYLNNELVTDLVIPDGVKTISSYAFEGCSSITSVTIPEGAETIDFHAFYDCTNLKSITIPDSIERVGREVFNGTAFYNNDENWEGNYLYIGPILISGGNAEGDISIKEGTTVIAGEAFRSEKITSVKIPEGVRSINDYAFYDCSDLSRITFPDSLKYVHSYALDGTAYINDESNWENGILYAGNVFYKANPSLLGENIEIRKGTEIIPYHAFYECSNLKSIVLPEGVTTIESEAFTRCSSLTDITIPGTLKYVGENAFQYCNNLKNVYISDIDAWCSINFTTYYSNPLLFAENIYLNDELVKNIVLNRGITAIKPYVFYGYKYLESVTIPEGVTEIGQYAFRDCTALTSITLPESLETIGSCAFYECSALTSITLPENLKALDSFAFSRCFALESIIIPNGTTTISDNAFNDCENLTSITIPDTVTKIGEDAFSWCDKIKEVHISDIGAWCKINFANLKSSPLNCEASLYLNGEPAESITVPSGITSINPYTFYGCDTIKSITLPEGLTSIGEQAFDNCDNLCRIYIPSSVSEINEAAFSSYSNLNTVFYGGTEEQWKEIIIDGSNTVFDNATICYECTAEDMADVPLGLQFVIENHQVSITKYTGTDTPDFIVPETIVGLPVTAIKEDAFYSNESLKSIVIPDNVTKIGAKAFAFCSNISDVTLSKNVTIIEESLFNYCTKLANINIPQGTTEIKAYAFNSCSELEKLVLPESVERIEKHAFSNCIKLKGINLPDGINFIGNYAFSSCSSLPEIKTPDSLTIINEGTFESCTNLTLATITDSVTTIGYKAFENCSSLPEINIPKSVKSIDMRAYNNCGSLTDVYYDDIEENWIQISIGEINQPLLNATKHFLGYAILTDEMTNISVESIEELEAELKVVKIDDTSEIENQLKGNKLVGLFDITLDKDGNPIQPNSPVTVRIPATNANTKVYRVEPDGTFTDMNAVFKNGYMVFETEHFSLYMLVETKIIDIDGTDPTVPDTEDYQSGDVNRDGKLNIKDATTIQKFSAKLIEFDEQQKKLGDFNSDNKVNVKDATTIQKKIAGLI